MDKRITVPRFKSYNLAWSILFLSGVIVLVQVFSFLAPILLSLILTLLLTLALNPVVLWLRAKTGSRNTATGLIFFVFALVVVSTIWAVVGPMKSSMSDLVDSLPRYWERLQRPLIMLEQQAVKSEEKLQAQVSQEQTKKEAAEDSPSDPETVQGAKVDSQDDLKDQPTAVQPGSIRKNLGEMLREALGGFTTMAFNGSQAFVVLITVFFGVIFSLLDPKPIFHGMFAVIPEAYHTQALRIIYRISTFAPSWAGSMLAGMLIIGTLVFLIMWPIFGLADALILGLIAGMFEAVPFLGPVLSTVPAMLLAFGQGGMTPLWVLLAFGAVQALENNVLLPMVMAQGMKIHAFAVIFSMLLCVSCFGALGVIIAAPMVAILKIIHDELFRERFLPTTTDQHLDRLAEIVLGETRTH